MEEKKVEFPIEIVNLEAKGQHSELESLFKTLVTLAKSNEPLVEHLKYVYVYWCQLSTKQRKEARLQMKQQQLERGVDNRALLLLRDVTPEEDDGAEETSKPRAVVIGFVTFYEDVEAAHLSRFFVAEGECEEAIGGCYMMAYLSEVMGKQKKNIYTQILPDERLLAFFLSCGFIFGPQAPYHLPPLLLDEVSAELCKTVLEKRLEGLTATLRQLFCSSRDGSFCMAYAGAGTGE
jgi:hypothetical protein